MGKGSVVPWAPFEQPVVAVAEMETSFVVWEMWLAPLLPVLAFGFLGVL